MAENIKAHMVESIGAVRGHDGQVGLIRFDRKSPPPNGEQALWVAVPNGLLPYLATLAIKMIPQPGGAMGIPLFPAHEVQFAIGPAGELILTMTLEKGAAISYRIDEGQARALGFALKDALEGAGSSAEPGPTAH